MTALQPVIQGRIVTLREQRVMLDADLAELYGVETRALVQAVKRNLARFPADFMFQLSSEEFTDLRSQSVISSSRNTRAQLKQVFDALRELMTPPDPPKRPIGFIAPENKGAKGSVSRRKT